MKEQKKQKRKPADVEYGEVITKQHVYIEWISFFAEWILFVIGLIVCVLFSKQASVFSMYVGVVFGLMLLFALLPFVFDYPFYLALWRAFRQGKQVVFLKEEKGSLFSSSLIGSKEVMIEE